MRNFQKKRGFKDILHSRPILIFLGLLVLFFAWGVFGFMGKMELTRQNKILAQDQVTELQKEKDDLTANIAKLNTPSGVEDNIREKFGLAKQGEGEIVVVDNNTPAPAPANTDGGFWGFIKNLFK